ncbi:putative ATP-dependent RNA helicase DHX37, partial [Trichinella nativa]
LFNIGEIMSEEPTYILAHDTSNAFVLEPRKKQVSKSNKDASIKGVNKSTKKKLKAKCISKKKAKELKKILSRKRKNVDRNVIYEKLSRWKISDEEMKLLNSVSGLHEKLKRRKSDLKFDEKIQSEELNYPAENENFVNNNLIQYFETETSAENEKSEHDNNEYVQNNISNADTSVQEQSVKLVVSAESTVSSVIENKQSLKLVNNKTATYVPIYRQPDIEKQRLKLPVVAEEQVIMEAIKECPVVIICGETGSGKTTQVPQFLYEAGMALNGKIIGITEPRRVAAISMSKRVAEEMNVGVDVVSYQIRFEGNTTEHTKVKFMTDGVLLREIQKDFLLSNYSAILIDEAHERSMYSDILIGLLSRIILLRQKRNDKLHLVIMSATLRVEDFLSPKLFKQTPRVIHVSSRQYPVTVHFNRHTDEDYLAAAFRKVCQVHRLLPEGAILVFVSGQQEVYTLVSWLKKTFPMEGIVKIDNNSNEKFQRRNFSTKSKRKRENCRPKNDTLINLDDYIIPADDKVDLNEMDAPDLDLFDTVEPKDDIILSDLKNEEIPLYCLPLYSLMESKKQARIFEPIPEGCRLCIISTNVAETSITIPNVRYVVDTGKEKVRLYDPVTGISKFVVHWISKASADQRAGRAGRVAPGHCYRLYSSAVYNEFEKYSTPEILTKPPDDLVLQMKSMNILRVQNFPFPSPLSVEALQASEERLLKLDLLERQVDCKGKEVTKITNLGRSVALFPLAPRYGKMLSLACQRNLLAHAVCLVAALSVREVLINPSSISAPNVEEKKRRIKACLNCRRDLAGQGQSLLMGDFGVMLQSVLLAEKSNNLSGVCKSYSVRMKALLEIRKLRRQLTNMINLIFPGIDLTLDQKLEIPNSERMILLRQLLLIGMCDNVARRNDAVSNNNRIAYSSSLIKDHLWIHPSSTLVKLQPEWVVYQEVIDGCNEKKCMINVLAIEPDWLPKLAKGYCHFGEPLKTIQPHYSAEQDCITCIVDCTYGVSGWFLSRLQVKHAENLDYYRYFAVEFLNGNVFSKLQAYKKYLVTSPSIIFKPWAKIQTRTDTFLRALVNGKISSKADLIRVWSTEKKFLRSEYLEWLIEAKHAEVISIWPPLDK